MREGTHRVAAPLMITLFVATALAGCFGGSDGDDTVADTSEAGHELTFMMSGFEPPEAGDDVAVTLTIGHIGAYDADAEEWVPLLTQAYTIDVFFDTTDPTVIDTIPVLAGRYTDIEIIADSARALTPTGTEPATIDESVCYTPFDLDLTTDVPPTEVELLLSGAEGLRGQSGSWTFRPALVGGFTDAEGAEPELGTVQCAA